jgi:hypothetical protein
MTGVPCPDDDGVAAGTRALQRQLPVAGGALGEDEAVTGLEGVGVDRGQSVPGAGRRGAAAVAAGRAVHIPPGRYSVGRLGPHQEHREAQRKDARDEQRSRPCKRSLLHGCFVPSTMKIK